MVFFQNICRDTPLLGCGREVHKNFPPGGKQAKECVENAGEPGGMELKPNLQFRTQNLHRQMFGKTAINPKPLPFLMQESPDLI